MYTNECLECHAVLHLFECRNMFVDVCRKKWKPDNRRVLNSKKYSYFSSINNNLESSYLFICKYVCLKEREFCLTREQEQGNVNGGKN